MDKCGKVSIVVPIYNIDNYLLQCLNSIKDQTVENFEVLMIDDGSTDKSCQICKKFSDTDKRYVYILQANSGVSNARNKGIELATGDYITFVDGDDLLDKDYLKILLKNITLSKLSACAYQFIDEDRKFYNAKKSIVNKILSNEEYCGNCFSNCKISYQGYVWGKLFVADIIKNNKIMFEKNIFYNEDRLFLLQYLSCSQTEVVYCTDQLYGYRIRENSAMGFAKKTYNSKMLTELFAFDEIIILLQKKYPKIYAGAVIDAFYAASHLANISKGKDYIKAREYEKNFLNQILQCNNIKLKDKIKKIGRYVLKK